MKVLSIAIPCYNSEAYMKKCINSLLIGGEQVEIIIVDDGSTDGTAAIADAYGKKYPDIIRVIHQENGGHGEAVNAGIRNASGMYFKVVDSDDYLARDPYLKVLDALKNFAASDKPADLVISNFVYDKQGAKRKKVMHYSRNFPHEEMFGWDHVARLPRGKYLLMHSLIYRTQLLRDCGLELPKHTFYVDNLFAYEPLPYVRNMYYIDVNLYRYFIGREDQSVHESVMIKRIDQQLLVNKLMVQVYDKGNFTEKHLKKYMYNYLEIITGISQIMLLRAGTDEALQKKKDLLLFIKEQNEKLYRKIRYGGLGILLNLPGKAGRRLTCDVYRILQKFYGFN